MTLQSLLSDGKWHAGPELAEMLGVSRAAVNKRVVKAREMGLEIQAVRGRGYRLADSFEPLESERIHGGLSGAAQQALDTVEVLAAIDSTNSWLLQRASGENATACFAEFQSGGRGRRGRQWVSPYGANLYFSVSWNFLQTPAGLGALSLAVGVELAEILARHGAPVGLKWPNDLVVEQQKLGGILIEHRGEVAGGSRVVIGVGINLKMQTRQAKKIGQPWTALCSHITLPGRNLLASELLDAVVRAAQTFGSEGFAPYRRRWQALDISNGRQVNLDTGSTVIPGIATGVAADGALIVDCGGRLQRFYAGELSLRLAE